MRWLRNTWTRFYCRWLLTAPACALKGHDWDDQHICLAMGATACTRCGCYRGSFQKDNGRERCSRLVIVKPGVGRLEVAKYPPIGPEEFLPGDGPVAKADSEPLSAPYSAEETVSRVSGAGSDGEGARVPILTEEQARSMDAADVPTFEPPPDHRSLREGDL